MTAIARLPAILACLLSLLLIAPGASAAPKCPAAGIVTAAGEAYDRAARQGTADAFVAAAGRFSNLRDMSLFALGRYRKDLPKHKEAEYLALTRRFIGAFMLDYGKDFRASNLTITDCDVSGANIVVTGQLSGGQKAIFRLAAAGSGFTIRDINLRGIWLVQQMRATFVGKVRSGGFGELFSYLKR